MWAGVETSTVRLGKLLRRLQPHRRPARWLERGRSASLGHSGRGITCSHAPRAGKPPLERLLASSSLTSVRWQRGGRPLDKRSAAARVWEGRPANGCRAPFPYCRCGRRVLHIHVHGETCAHRCHTSLQTISPLALMAEATRNSLERHQ